MSATVDPGGPASGAATGRGSWSRLSFGAQSILAALLAAAAAVLAVDVADWRYVRVDLSDAGRNTLDPAVLDVIDQLPEPVVIDVFFRTLSPPFDGLSLEAQGRFFELLRVASQARRPQVEVRTHDPTRVEEARGRQLELGVEGENLVVFSCGGRKAEVALFGEIALVDWGNPTLDQVEYLTRLGFAGVVDPRSWNPDPRAYRPARLSEFRGEEALAQALLKVQTGSAPRAYFARGHGEPDLRGTLTTDLSRLRAALERDGFEVREWDASETPSVPADCEVLALIGARQALQPAERQAVVDHVDRGGRVVLAPDLEEVEERVEGGITDLMRSFGIVPRPGIVCQSIVGASGQELDGLSECAFLLLDASALQSGHPLTESLRRRDRRVEFALTPSLEGSRQTDLGLVLALISTPPACWRDLALAPGRYDYGFDPTKGEERGRFALACVAELPAARDSSGAVRRGRVLGVACASFFSNAHFGVNRDFALNAFNWLADREYRLTVAPLAKGETYLALDHGKARPVLTWTLLLVLPGLCAAVGGYIAWRRRSP